MEYDIVFDVVLFPEPHIQQATLRPKGESLVYLLC